MAIPEFSKFLEAVVSIFVIVNPLGNLPLFAGLAEDVPAHERRRVFRLSGLVAFCIISAFAVAGKYILRDVFHITIAEFTFGGGLLLVTIGIYTIMDKSLRPAHDSREQDPAARADREITLAVSPIAFPLLVGPGSIVTVMLIVDHHGSLYGVAASAVAFIFVMAILHWSDTILNLMGKVGAIAIGRILQIFIVALGVHFIFAALTQSFPNLLQ
ncbi:MAG: MarC family protein [Syntrophaceae bacterium]|nr:MarC family protein [Syntrophaceae bacterium]